MRKSLEGKIGYFITDENSRKSKACNVTLKLSVQSVVQIQQSYCSFRDYIYRQVLIINLALPLPILFKVALVQVCKQARYSI